MKKLIKLPDDLVSVEAAGRTKHTMSAAIEGAPAIRVIAGGQDDGGHAQRLSEMSDTRVITHKHARPADECSQRAQARSPRHIERRHA